MEEISIFGFYLRVYYFSSPKFWYLNISMAYQTYNFGELISNKLITSQIEPKNQNSEISTAGRFTTLNSHVVT